MLSVKTNKDITKFKTDVMGGFNLKETISIIIGMVAGSIIIFCLMRFTPIPKMLCPYIAVPVMGLPLLHTFYNKDGMGFVEHLKREKKFKKGKPYSYQSTETSSNYNKYLEKAIVEEKNCSDDEFKKTLRKMIIMGIVLSVVIIGIIVAVVVLR